MIDIDLRSADKIQALIKRLEYIKVCFERCNEMKSDKIE